MEYTLVFWLILAFVGLILYVYPTLSMRRMYEAFANSPPPADPGKSAADYTTIIQNMEKLLQPTLNTPKLGDDAVSPLAPKNMPNSPQNTPTASVNTNTNTNASTPPTGGKSVPADSTVLKSTPQTAADAQKSATDKSTGLDQGKVFQKSLPTTPVLEILVKNETSSNNRENSYEAYKHARRCARTKICPHPKKCPPQRQCPPPEQCPDMSKYIRKDSIPCWGCKLPTK